MDWKKINLPAGSKLLKIHNFIFMHKSAYYSLEVNEFNDGTFAGYGEHTADKNYVIESVSGATVEDCLNALVEKIKQREA